MDTKTGLRLYCSHAQKSGFLASQSRPILISPTVHPILSSYAWGPLKAIKAHVPGTGMIDL